MAAFHLWGQLEVDLVASSHTSQCQHYYTLEHPLPLGGLRLNAFNHPWTYQLSYVFPPPTLVPLVLLRFQTRTCHRSIQTSYSVFVLLNGGSLASQSSQHVRRHSLSGSQYKKPHHDLQ